MQCLKFFMIKVSSNKVRNSAPQTKLFTAPATNSHVENLSLKSLNMEKPVQVVTTGHILQKTVYVSCQGGRGSG